jgi:hypothetical protein
MLTSDDRVVAFRPHRGWEVRIPGDGRRVLRSANRAEAFQWAWNIVRTTGGKVVLHRSNGRLA